MSSIFLCAKRHSVQIDKAQRVFSLLWNAFAELKDSNRTAKTPLKSRRIKVRIGLWHQDGWAIIFGLRNTHSKVAVSH
jgi:hypothetical protein